MSDDSQDWRCKWTGVNGAGGGGTGSYHQLGQHCTPPEGFLEGTVSSSVAGLRAAT